MITNGNRGNTVLKWQNDLIQMGFGEDLGQAGNDGIFGKNTATATRKFQSWSGIKVDAKVGTQTNKAMTNAKKNAGKNGTRNFRTHEFRSRDNGSLPKGGLSAELLCKLEILRYRLGNRPVKINSGYRTMSHNQKVGGASNSQHLYGRAGDIVVEGVKPSKVYATANNIFSNGGVGKYNTFTHVDTRGYKARF